MANTDAQFVFGHNLGLVRKEITAELERISAAVAETSGPQGGDFLGGLTKGITSDVRKAISEIRRIKAEAERAVAAGGTRAAGQPTVSVQLNDVITGLTKQLEDRVRKAALKAGANLGQLDLSAIMRELDAAFTKRARDEARALVRSVERTGTSQAQSVFGSSKDIRTGVPRTTLTTPGELQQQAADEKRARRESAASARRLAKSTDAIAEANAEQASETQQETGRRRNRGRRLAQSEQALAAANEEAAASTRQAAKQSRVVKIDPEAAQKAESARVTRGIAFGDPNFGYATRTGQPGTGARAVPIVDRTDPNNLRFFNEKNGGTSVEEIPQESLRYARLLRQENERLERQQQAEAEAEAERLVAIRAATQVQDKAAQSQSIRDSLLTRNGQYNYISKGDTPTKDVYTGDSRDSLRVFRQDKDGGFDEITSAHKDYVAAIRRAQDSYDRRAAATTNATAAERAAAEALAAAEVAAARSADIKARLARNDPSAQYLTDSGRPNTRVAVGPDGQLPTDPKNTRYFERRGDEFHELLAGEQKYTDALRLHNAQLKDGTTAVDRARDASNRYAESLRKSSASSVGVAGGGGFGGGFSSGVFSGGFGDSGDTPAFGLGRSLGQTVKYSLLYKVFNDLLTVMQQVGQEFLNVDDSFVELQYAMVDGAGATTDFVNSLQDIAAPGGFNVGDAMDQAAAAIRAYRDEIIAAGGDTKTFEDDIGRNFTKGAAQIAVIAKTSLADALQNTRATALGFDLEPNTAAGRVADAVANAKRSGGGLEKDISQGGANIAEIGHAAGFSLEESLNVVSKLSAKLDESGTLAATRFSRMIGTLQGSAGKNFLTELNQSLPTGQQVDITASPRDQILQIAAATDTLNEAQKQQLATAIGGQAQQREFNVLISSFGQLAKDAANSEVGLADKEYQDRLANVRGLLGQIRGELIGIVTNLATSGVLAPFGLLLKILEPILAAARDITKTFNLIPSSIRDIGLALLGVYATMKAITALRNAGGGSILEGVRNKLRGAERVVLPSQAEARERLELTGNHDADFHTHVRAPAERDRDATFRQIEQDERSGALTMGAARKAREQAETDYRAAIRTNTADYKREAKRGAEAVQQGGNDVRASFRRLRGDEMGNNLRSLRDGIVRGQRVVEGAFAGAGSAIKSGATGLIHGFTQIPSAVSEGRRIYGDLRTPMTVHPSSGDEGPLRVQTSRLSAAAAVVREGSVTAGAGLRRVGEAAVGAAAALNASRLGRGVEAASGAVGRGVGRAVRGVGAAVASEFGPIGIGLMAADLGLQLKESFDQISQADRALAAAASIDVKQGAQALSDAAKANEEAAKQMREAAGGFFGGIANFLQGGVPGERADRAEEFASQQQALADRLQAQQATAITRTGPEALAAQIDTSSGDGVKTSIQNLLDAGQGASNVLDAITIALKSLKFAATGTVGELTGLQQTDLAGRMGINAGKTVELLRKQASDLRNRQVHAQTNDEYQGLDAMANGLAEQLDALGPNGSHFLNNRVSEIIDQFFKGNPAANLNDPKVQQALQTQIQKELASKYGVRGDTANTAAGLALAVLPQERDKQLTELADPKAAAALVQGGINAAGLAGDTVAQNAKLQSLRTGAPDRSATQGLKVQQQKLQELQATVQGDIDAMEAAIAAGDKSKDPSGLRLQLAVIQNALVAAEVKQAEQLIANAKSDVDDIEGRRKVRQAAATTAAQVAAIGQEAITAELDKAVPTHDADLIKSVMERASNAELDTYQRTLDNVAAAADAEVESARQRAIALGELNPDGTVPDVPAPSPLLPGAPNPQNSLPDILKPKPPGVESAQGKANEAHGRADDFRRLRRGVIPTGAAEAGSDVPGGTPEEKRAAADAARAERNRDSTAAAAAKVRAAKAALDKITDHSTQEYHQAQEQYYAALNAQADLQQDTAVAQAKAGLYPGDKVGAAKVALDEARNQIGRFAKGSKEYWDTVARFNQAQVDYAAAQREQANLIAQTHIDLTDPVQVANQALKDARRKKRDDIAAHADKGTLAQDDIDIANKAAGADQAAFQQKLSDAQTAEQLGRISHAAYMRYLQGEHDRLTDRLSHMKKSDQMYRQTLDQLNEIDKDMKEASNQLSGQFNLGDIKIPTVYEVRRSLKAATGTDVQGVTNSAQTARTAQMATTNNVTVNGADFARVVDYLNGIFGKTGRVTTTPRKA